jgi:cysteine-rich secretory family protein
VRRSRILVEVLQIAQSNTLAHNGALPNQVSGWETLGENVGDGPSVDSLEQAFEASPHHYENMVDARFRTIGVGVVEDGNGLMWVTEDYEQPLAVVAAPTPVAPDAIPGAASPLVPVSSAPPAAAAAAPEPARAEPPLPTSADARGVSATSVAASSWQQTQ